ncbi:MAG TPA: helix-turn-helix domain-containing protein, partial [Gemmatimonadaceae bacterium]|nr:helix-turn-helix domain-containing protein [Gemmatimonadaceae bacterium]
VGVPPYAYLALVRVRRARALIARGHPLSSVTYVTGFSDQSHLTRQFKRVVGVPPGRYARAASRA